MADTASLVVRVKSEGVGKTDRDLSNLSNTANKTEKSAVTLASAMKGVTIIATAVAAAVTVTGGALGKMTLESAKNERELTNLSKTAKTTREDFAALSFVFKQYGVDAKGTADAMNDVSERLGEFAAAASGPFQDFADVMGLTKKQAVDMANELQRMKPEDAITRMVAEMEKANVQGAQMSFVLKSMSNDLEYASAAFENNGSKIKGLKKEFSELNRELILNQRQADQLATVATQYELLTSALGGASSVISSSLAPTMNGFFNSIIEVVPNATNTIVDFINTFNDASEIQSVAQIDRQMKDLADTIENGVAKNYDKMSSSMRENPLDFVRVGEYQNAVKRLSELEAQRNKILEEQKKRELEIVTARSGGTIAGGIGKEAAKVVDKDTKDNGAQKAQAEAYLEQLRQSNLSEMQLIDVQEQEKQTKVKESYDLKLISEQQYQDALTEIQTNAVLSRATLETQILDEQSKAKEEIRKGELARVKEESRIREKQIDDGIDAQRNMTANLKSALGEQSSLYKASAIVTATIDTYKAATGAYAAMASIPYVGPVLGGIAAGAAVVAGLANVAAIRGAREQGGSLVGGGAYQMAERGKAEVIMPAGASRARTAAQMRDIMGQNGGGASNVTIVNNTTGRVDNVQTEQRDDGMLMITIEENIINQMLDPDSRMSKARRSTANQAGF